MTILRTPRRPLPVSKTGAGDGFGSGACGDEDVPAFACGQLQFSVRGVVGRVSGGGGGGSSGDAEAKAAMAAPASACEPHDTFVVGGIFVGEGDADAVVTQFRV